MRVPYRLRLAAVCLALVGLSLSSAAAAEPAARPDVPWNMAALEKAPPAEWGDPSGPVQEVYYEGEPLDGKPTRVFAYYAQPASGKGPFPGMVLVHGGGGTAFAEWATLWANRGYAALAMDLAGCGPDQKRLPDGGPGQGDDQKFAPFSDPEIGRMWTYHAVAAAIRGHSLLASRDEVDGQRTGVTGISWGGYLTSIIAGVDHRFKVAVPVYGCGFLHENSAWVDILNKMPADQRERWLGYFDSSRYLDRVQCPILFVNGTNDFAYPMDSHRKSFRLVPGRADLRMEVRMNHSHVHGWAPREIGLFVDSVLTGGAPLARLGPIKTTNGKASAEFQAVVPVVRGNLHYTTDTGKWQERQWQTVNAAIAGATVAAELPPDRPIAYYLSITDGREAMVSTEYAELR